MDQVTKFACFLLVSRCKLYLSLSLSLTDSNNHCLVSVTKCLELWTSHQKKRKNPDLNRSLKILYILSLTCIWQFVSFNGSRIWGNLDLFWTDRVGTAIAACQQTHAYTHAHSPQTTPFPHTKNFLAINLSTHLMQFFWYVFLVCLYLNSNLRCVLYGPPIWLPDRLVHGEEYNTLKWRIVILELGVCWKGRRVGGGHDSQIAQPTKFLVSSNGPLN